MLLRWWCYWAIWSKFNKRTVCKNLGRCDDSNRKHLDTQGGLFWQKFWPLVLAYEAMPGQPHRQPLGNRHRTPFLLSDLLVLPSGHHAPGSLSEPRAGWERIEGGSVGRERRTPAQEAVVSSRRLREWCLLCGLQRYRLFLVFHS